MVNLDMDVNTDRNATIRTDIGVQTARFDDPQQKEWNRLVKRLPTFCQIQCPPEPYPDIDLFARTDEYDIPVWEYNKIRENLLTIYHKQGMRVRFGRYDTFLWGMALSVPDGYMIAAYDTKILWNNNPTNFWRIYRIAYVGEEGAPSDFIENLPFGIGNTIMDFIQWTSGKTTQSLGVFENWAYKNTMASEVILCNWDKILKVLNENGY